MATPRATKETLYLRREFTADERLEMGRDLAQAHNRIAAIDDEEKAMKSQIKDRRAGIDLSIGTISRKLNDGYEMENVSCTLHWDEPNVGEVTYRNPAGEVVKARAMTAAERQMDLPLDESTTELSADQVEERVEQSKENANAFFDAGPAPSAEDLDAAAEEAKVKEATGPVLVEKPGPKDLPQEGDKPAGW
jgi:hypothetical protein